MIATSDFRPLEPIAGEPDIDESYIRQCDPVVLQTLLIDRTETHLNKGTPVNIKWATEDYARQYDGRTGYGSEDQIMPDAISTDRAVDLKVVTPRVKKRLDEQRRRSVEKAEVFTPCKGCKSGKVEDHNGVRCLVMDWKIGKPVLFMPPFDFKPIEEQEKK